MFSPFPDYILWFVSFALELSGAVLTFRRQKSLFAILSFRAAADLISFLALYFFGMEALQWVDYVQRMFQYPILSVLAVCCIGAAFKENSRTVRWYSVVVAALTASALVAIHGTLDWTLQNVLWIEEKTAYALALIVAGCMALREAEAMRGRMEKPWGMISAGLLLLLASDGLSATARAHHWVEWMTASRWKSGCAIVAMVIWLIDPARMGRMLRKAKEQFEHAKFTSVATQAKTERWVM